MKQLLVRAGLVGSLALGGVLGLGVLGAAPAGAATAPTYTPVVDLRLPLAPDGPPIRVRVLLSDRLAPDGPPIRIVVGDELPPAPRD
jgi:hypothetical protein